MSQVIFILLVAASVAFFARTSWLFGRAVFAGVPDPRPRLDQLPGRLVDVGIYFFGQKKVAEEGPQHRTSKHHLFIFWGFLIITVATADLMSVTAPPPSALAGELGWRSGVLVFRRMTLADAASEFNRYNRKKLVVLDPAVANRKIDGTFPANDVEAFLDAVQATLRVHVEDLGSEAVISH